MRHISRSTHNKGKKFKQNLTKIYSKSTKIAISARKPLKFFRGSMPPDPPRVFLVFQSAFNWFCKKNTLEKNVEIAALRF